MASMCRPLKVSNNTNVNTNIIALLKQSIHAREKSLSAPGNMVPSSVTWLSAEVVAEAAAVAGCCAFMAEAAPELFPYSILGIGKVMQLQIHFL